MEHLLDHFGAPLRALSPCLVHHENVGDFHDARLRRLDIVALAGRESENNRLGHVHDLDFGLTDPHRFDEDDVPAHHVEDLDGLTARPREAAQVAARGHAPDKNIGIGEVPPEANPVAEDGSARERARRIDGEEGNALSGRPEFANQLIGQCALADAGRPGQGDGPGLSSAAIDFLDQRTGRWVAVLDSADKP